MHVHPDGEVSMVGTLNPGASIERASRSEPQIPTRFAMPPIDLDPARAVGTGTIFASTRPESS